MKMHKQLVEIGYLVQTVLRLLLHQAIRLQTPAICIVHGTTQSSS
jgi:hypothetical protein